MKELPDITVLICTYERPTEIVLTLEALDTYLSYPAERLHWLIADDSSVASTIASIKKSAVFKKLKPKIVKTDTNSGWGKNVNNGLQQVDTEFVFFLEDDYCPKAHIDLDHTVPIMLEKPDIGMFRYRGTAGSHLVYHGFEADIREYVPKDWASGIGAVPGKITYLQLDSGSPDLYLYSHGPHLKHRRFHEFYGKYPEGLLLGQTEEFYAHTVKDKMREPGAPAIAILPGYINMLFDHIGKSYQLTDKDRANV